MPNWEMRLWDDIENIDLMESHLPQFAARFKIIKRGVVKADIARYLYMHAFGGLYIDTDYKLLRPISAELLRNPCILPASIDPGPAGSALRLGNAVLASEPGHEFWAHFLEEIFATAGLEDLPEGMVEKVTGPEGLTDFYVRNPQFHSRIYIPEKRLFHPTITWHGFSYDRRFPAYGAHLCWGSWRSKRLPKNVKILLMRKLTSL